jgi:hypothetical protein
MGKKKKKTTTTTVTDEKPPSVLPPPPSLTKVDEGCRNPIPTRTIGYYLFRTMSMDLTKYQEDKWILVTFRAKVLFSIYLIVIQIGWFFAYKRQVSLLAVWLTLQEWIIMYLSGDTSKTDLTGSVFTMGLLSIVITAGTAFPLLLILAEDGYMFVLFGVLILVEWFVNPVEVLLGLWSTLIVSIVLFYNPYYCSWFSLLRLVPAIGVWFPLFLVTIDGVL